MNKNELSRRSRAGKLSGLAFRARLCDRKAMNLPRWILACGCLLLAGCSDDEAPSGSEKQAGGALDRSKRIRELETSLDRLKWENSRLSLKIETVNGQSLAMDKKTGLWHNDVARQPFTGRVAEEYPDRSPRAEAGFLNGKKDGMERFWYPNGQLKSEGQWFEGKQNGVFRQWSEEGKVIRVVRYKNGQVIENLRQ